MSACWIFVYPAFGQQINANMESSTTKSSLLTDFLHCRKRFPKIGESFEYFGSSSFDPVRHTGYLILAKYKSKLSLLVGLIMFATLMMTIANVSVIGGFSQRSLTCIYTRTIRSSMHVYARRRGQS
jgi:hypothetical protein